jgi:3-deoxy-7-phosphoheptulonate synthase
MIVVMKSGCASGDVDHVVELIRQYGLKDHVIVGTDRTVVAAIGDKRGLDMSAIENAPMVEAMVPILKPYKVASKEVKKDPSIIDVGNGHQIGGRHFAVVAGPCSVESESQLMKTAEAVKAAGAIGLRGGAFKPRTSPYDFRASARKG